MIALIDYGVGNLRSVAKALEHIGAPVQIVQQPHDLAGAEGIILPGVGAFGDAAATFRQAGFEQPLLAAVRAGTPLLGICVGLQLLFDTSEEMGRHRGLGIFPGIVTRFADGMTVTHNGARHLLKVPQIGWNQIHHDHTHPLLAGVPSGSYAYITLVDIDYLGGFGPQLKLHLHTGQVDYFAAYQTQHKWNFFCKLLQRLPY